MTHKIYHGSAMEIPKPLLSKGKENNDYGRGFYCTDDIEMAREWACRGKSPHGMGMNTTLARSLSCRIEDLME